MDGVAEQAGVGAAAQCPASHTPAGDFGHDQPRERGLAMEDTPGSAAGSPVREVGGQCHPAPCRAL